MTLPVHLSIITVVIICLLGFIGLKRKKFFISKKKSFWLAVVVFLSVYLLILGLAIITDVYYQWNLERYDLDGDGFFSGKEQTKEQQVAMQKLTNDVGRNFSFITGFIFAFIIGILTYICSKLYYSNLSKNSSR